MPERPTRAGASEHATTGWIEDHAHPFTTSDPHASLDDLQPLADIVGEATVVGLGDAVRSAHELTTLKHRVLRFLVETMGFRSVTIEEGWASAAALDDHVRTGSGDPRQLLSDAWTPWQTEEMLDVIGWMRSYNEQHGTDPVRFVGVDEDHPRLEEVERRLASNTISWHENTGHKIVYWGGMGHIARGDPRTASAPPLPLMVDRNAGSHLHEHFGDRYVPVGFTFDHGSVPFDVPPPSPRFAEASFSRVGVDQFLLDLRAPSQPDAVRAWLNGRATTRLIGPHYDVDHDADYHLSGSSLAGWFDAVIHVQQVTPTHPLSP